MSIIWNTGLAAERARARAQRDAAQFNLKLKKKKAAPARSSKLQAREDIIYEENERLLDRSSKRQASSSKRLKKDTIK